MPVPQGWFKLHRPLDNGETMARPVIMMFRRKMYSTQMKRTVQIVKCIYMSDPREQSLTLFKIDNHAKIFLGEVKVDFDMLLKLL